jgi:hypothetical protein
MDSECGTWHLSISSKGTCHFFRGRRKDRYGNDELESILIVYSVVSRVFLCCVVFNRILAILAHHYPERAHRVYWVDAPVIFRCVWAIVKPFLDPVTKAKCVFVTGDEQRAKVFGSILEPDQAMPYQRPDGTMIPPSNMEDFFLLPVDQAHGEEVQ